MRAASRLGDECTGHDCFPPRINDQGSPDTFINGLAAHRVGDHWVEHSCDDETHDGLASEGSATVFINGHAAMRVGDTISCGSVVAQGSSNTFFG